MEASGGDAESEWDDGDVETMTGVLSSLQTPLSLVLLLLSCPNEWQAVEG
jgi:hypothetical protein